MKSNRKGSLFIVILLMILGVVIYTGFKGYLHKLNPLNITETENKNQQLLREEELKQQHEEHNPNIVLQALQRDSELLVTTGSITYQDAYYEQNWYSDKRLDVNLNYNYGIGYSTEYIKAEYEDNNLIIKLNSSCLHVKYTELADNNMTVTKSLLASQYKPSEVGSILKIAKTDVTNYIIHNQNIADESYNNLINMITEMLQKANIDYDNISFVNVGFVME